MKAEARREVLAYVLPCPVCKITQERVSFLPAGDGPGEPAEIVDVAPVSGPFCECYESGLVDQGEYDAKLLKQALGADMLCGSPEFHGPSRRATEREAQS